MTDVPGSIQSRMMAVSVTAVLSSTGTRNNLLDPRLAPPMGMGSRFSVFKYGS